MLIIIILVALLAMIFGFLFLFSPQALKKMNKKASQVISKTDDAFLKNRIPVGIILLAGSLIMFYLTITIMIR